MKMKLWIIYKDGIGLARLVAEMLQDRLENFLDVSVGEASKIDPVFLIEEKPDLLIIGDIIQENKSSKEISNWMKKFQEMSDKLQFSLKTTSAFFITTDNREITADWGEKIRNNSSYGSITPPFMHFNLNTTNLLLEGTFDKVKKFSDGILKIVLDEE
jgi:hypothetical protein